MRHQIDRFTRAYIEALLWSESDDHEKSFHERGYADYAALSDDAIERCIADCEEFQEQNADDLADEDPEQAGHDFALTRNGHGAGFWDGDYEEEKGKRLTDSSDAFGECHLYMPDSPIEIF